MNPITSALTPSATTMNRLDHAHVLATFQQYRASSRPQFEFGLVNSTYMALMRDVLRHVAEEETVRLPEAERLLQDHLAELRSQMMKRRLQLVAPRTADTAVNLARALPIPSIALLAGATVAGLLLGRQMTRD